MHRTHTNAPSNQFGFQRPSVPGILAGGITAVAYLATLRFGFVYDDVPQILKNPAIQSWRYLPRYFTSHVWAAIYPNSPGNYYRPLFLLWLRLNYVIFATDPFGWHLASVLCHVLATYLVFCLALQLTRARAIAFSAAVLFGVHPAHIENVAWISGVTDPLMACGVLGSCLAFLRWREWRKRSLLALSIGLFAVAMLSKETAVVLPCLIVALATRLEDTNAGENGRPHLLAAVREAVPYLLLALVYVAVRCHALKGFSHATIPISWPEVFFTLPSVLWFYARHLLFPVRLSEFYALDYVRHFTAHRVLLPLLLLMVLGLALYRWIRLLSAQKQVVMFALVLMVMPLLPVLDLRSLTPGDIVHDRYLYLPSAGFALLAAISIAALAERVPDRLRTIAPTALTAVAALLFGALTVTQQMQWANDIALYARGIESAPDNLTVRDNLANALMVANQSGRAIPLYLDVLKRNPDFWRSNYNLGYAYYKTSNVTAAEEYFLRAIRIDNSDPDQFIYLALVQLRLKKLPQAAENARRAIAKNPQAHGYHFILGLICEAGGDRDGALTALRTELAMYPDNAPAAAELQKITESR